MCSLLNAIFWFLGLSICTASPVNYNDRPDDFLEMFVNCVRKENCVFYFWHIAKTGGTTMNFNFENLFRLKIEKNTCCMEGAMWFFEKNVTAHCFSKSSSYEVTGDQMRMIVETCTKLRPSSNAIVMFTYREPVARFVSKINHLCNKRYKTRSAYMQMACDRCAYEPDTKDFFQKLILQQNNLYLAAPHIAKMNFENVQVLLVDTMDLYRFLGTLSLLPGFNAIKMIKNVAYTKRCDFGITSEIIKELSTSVKVYRNLSVGEY